MLLLFFGVFVSFVAPTPAITPSDDTLQLVHVFFRHGDRTPEPHGAYPKDPYKLEDFLPMGFGQLTNQGKQRAYKLGKMLRERYDSFLGEIYTNELVETVSTDFDRTKMSALLVLAGLFPPAPSQQWDSELPWLPIPYFFEKGVHDYFIRRPTHYCPRYVEELEKQKNSPEYKNFLEDHAKDIEYITEHAGKPLTTLHDVFQIYQTLHSEENMNFTLPEWTDAVYPELISKFAAKQCEMENSNAILKRLNGGRMLKKVLQHIKSKTDGYLKPKHRKIYLYSGHENNVINILAALNLFETHVPEYSAAAIIELHYLKDLDTYAVKVLYAKHVDKDPLVRTMPDCESLCPLDKFIKIASPHVPLNYTVECESDFYLGE